MSKATSCSPVPLRLITVAILLAGAGCFSEAAVAKQRRDLLVHRATFDLSCPAESLRTTCLDAEDAYCASMGVEGCGHRATYIMAQINAAQYEWVVNTIDGTVK